MAEFAELRTQVPIERVLSEMLGVNDFERSGKTQLLGTCPLCGRKALKVTPRLGMCNCFADKGKCAMGGGIIKIVSVVKKITHAQAGDAIEQYFGLHTERPKPSPTTRTAEAPRTFDPIEYQARLNPEAEELAPLKISSGIIRQFGGGWAAKGKLGGHLALPLYDGTVIKSFFGVPLEDGDIKFVRDEDRNAVFNAAGLEAEERLTVVRDPLSVLRAAENGDTQCIAVFTEYGPEALRRIAAVLDANKIEECDLF
jgi:hypothetical protein